MHRKLLLLILAVGLMTAASASPVQAGQQKSIFELAGSEEKYTAGDFRPAPETMHTRFGTLDFPGGYPTDATVRKVYDELDLQRATRNKHLQQLRQRHGRGTRGV